jgi:hypothetical protein
MGLGKLAMPCGRNETRGSFERLREIRDVVFFGLQSAAFRLSPGGSDNARRQSSWLHLRLGASPLTTITPPHP